MTRRAGTNFSLLLALVALLLVAASTAPVGGVTVARAQAVTPPQLSDRDQPAPPGAAPSAAATHFGSSPFAPPEADDAHFVVDRGPGLDTGCTFRSGGPLRFDIEVDRVAGDIAKLKAAGLVGQMARLQMPAFDVDFFGGGGGFNPERDRVKFNDNVVPVEFLTGNNGIWLLNDIEVPIEWLLFPADPGPGGTPTPKRNTVEIMIDTANTQEVWCTAIDWAVLSVDIARPVVMVHGIFSSGGTWNESPFSGVAKLADLGLPNSNRLNMGNLDGIASNAGKIGTEVDDATRRWGVDKVNIVGHSKGGIDSRHFVETSDKVEQLIQLGTPNAGSPLADRVQLGVVAGTGILGAIAINALAGPAGVQLTQPYMATYNRLHGPNPKVRYTAVAGNYDPVCWICHPIWSALLAITGPGDTIVPIDVCPCSPLHREPDVSIVRRRRVGNPYEPDQVVRGVRQGRRSGDGVW